MPTDPATVPPLTEQEIGHFRHEYRTTGISFEEVARNIYALAASRVDTAEVERRAARKACNAMRDWFIGLRSVGAAQTFSEHRDAYLAREYPAPAPRECVPLSDGRVVEWMQWSMRNGVSNERTLDIVTNKDKPGCESRRCFRSIDEMRASVSLPWADWQAIDKRFAAEVGQ